MFATLATPVAVASADTSAAVQGSTLTYTGGTGNNRIWAQMTNGRVSMTDQSGAKIVPGGGCVKGANANRVLCNTSGIRLIEAHLGGGNDAFLNSTDFDSHVYGEAGDDRGVLKLGKASNGYELATEGLVGGRNFDVVDGGPGADDVYDMGGGSTSIYGLQNVLNGGDGNDLVTNGMLLGVGFLPIPIASSATALMTGGNGNDSLFGWDAAELLNGGAGVDSLTGGGGDDRLEARDGAKDKLVDCDDAQTGHPGGADKYQVDPQDPIKRCEIAQ